MTGAEFMSGASIMALLDAALAAHRAGARLHLSLHGDDAVRVLTEWVAGRGVRIEHTSGVGSHPRGEMRWTMVRVSHDGIDIATAHSTPVVIEQLEAEGDV